MNTTNPRTIIDRFIAEHTDNGAYELHRVHEYLLYHILGHNKKFQFLTGDKQGHPLQRPKSLVVTLATLGFDYGDNHAFAS